MPTPIQELMTSVGAVASGTITMVGSIAAEIVSNPVLLIGIGLGVLGAAVGIFSRFFKK